MSRRVHEVLFGIFIGLLVIAPLFFGGNRPAPWSGLGLITAGLLVGSGGATALHPTSGWIPSAKLWGLAGLFSVPLVWAFLQTTPFTPVNWHNPLWQSAADSLSSHQIRGRISLDPAGTETALMRLLTYGGAFWLALLFGQDDDKRPRLVQAIAIAGLVYAVYGLSLYIIGIQKVLWVKKVAYIGDVTSTFYNKNSYATYAGLGLFCAVGLLLTRPFEKVNTPVEQSGRALRRCIWRAAAAICLTGALLLTHSRAGFVCAGLGLAALLILLGISRSLPLRYSLTSVTAVLAAASVIFVLLGGKTAEGLATIGVVQPSGGLEIRLEVYRRVLQAVGDAPLLGTGYGTFADAFRPYQGTVVEGFWDHAHNTYLENLMELGIPATVCLLAAIVGVVAACAKEIRGKDREALYPCLGLAASVQVGTHAFFDFSLEMPGIAITYAALLGTACARSRSTNGSTDVGNREGRSPNEGSEHTLTPLWTRIFARDRWRSPPPACIAGLGLLALAVPHSVAAFLTLPGEPTVVGDEQARGPGAIDGYVSRQRAAARWVDDGQFWANIARANLSRLGFGGFTLEGAHYVADEARAALEHSLERKPSDPYVWAQLAEMYFVQRRDPVEIGKALNLSLLTGPVEWPLVLPRCRLALKVWPHLEGDVRSSFGRQFVMATARFGEHFADLVLRLERVDAVRESLGIDQDQQHHFEALVAHLRQS